MKHQLGEIETRGLKEIHSCLTLEILEELRIAYLGKKGELTGILKGMGKLSPEERPILGDLANRVREKLESGLTEKKQQLEQEKLKKRLEQERIDVTLPCNGEKRGKKHPLTQVLDEIKEIFLGMGFSVEEGPEIELDYYNFEALNLPQNHPARDTQDTFYITENLLLRTQTSPVQVRTMEQTTPPIKIIAPGRVYRSDAVDATHSPIFHQIEGLVVDKDVSFSDLKGTLEIFCKKMYGEKAILRFRPHHFPFTEPSAEVDIQCFSCQGVGCSLCKKEGWIEILGCGMVHPNVIKNAGLDEEIYSGFAFGMGLERIVMRKYNITDLRLFFENDQRFLEQF